MADLTVVTVDGESVVVDGACDYDVHRSGALFLLDSDGRTVAALAPGAWHHVADAGREIRIGQTGGADDDPSGFRFSVDTAGPSATENPG